MSRSSPARRHGLALWPIAVLLGLAIIVAACDDPLRSVPLGSLQIDIVFPYTASPLSISTLPIRR